MRLASLVGCGPCREDSLTTGPESRNDQPGFGIRPCARSSHQAIRISCDHPHPSWLDPRGRPLQHLPEQSCSAKPWALSEEDRFAACPWNCPESSSAALEHSLILHGRDLGRGGVGVAGPVLDQGAMMVHASAASSALLRVIHSVGNVVQALAGKPRSSEYDNELEQDPRGHEHGSGSNDDMWGEWCAPS